ncbi:pancreatic secretory granule membrane major glycoprotein GP2-like [Dendropsophus ebraccatus]|uniref:pancreatic secretory granule membrane major glycoprotein GP2-like n=1 Tax=Dendropsophus ebraccatus TaxID=150705 RepID=UPI003831E255
MQVAGNPDKCAANYADMVNGIMTTHLQIRTFYAPCGNNITNDTEKLYISNTVHIDILKSPLITVNQLNFTFTCSMNLSMQISLNSSLHPIVGTTILQGINGTGSFPLTMAAFRDDKFTNVISQSDTVTVGTDIFLGLFVTAADGNLLTLRVVNCVASPTNSRSDAASVPLVTGGCAAGGYISTVVEQNGVSLEARIRVGSFRFQSTDSVYVFCDVRLCERSPDCSKCDPSGSSRSSEDTRSVMIQLPYENYDLSSSSVTHSALPWAVLCGTLLGFLSNTLF